MIFDRKQQFLLLEGKEYTSEDIARFVAEGAENYPSAIWDLYLFLNEWFNDSPVITIISKMREQRFIRTDFDTISGKSANRME